MTHPFHRIASGIALAASLAASFLVAACAQPGPEVRSAQWEENALIVDEGNPALSN